MSKDESDEITIDFSTIKKWFGSKKKASEQENQEKQASTNQHSAHSPERATPPTKELESQDQSDKDVTIDLKSLTLPLKRLFSSEKRTEHEASKHPSPSTDEGLSISWPAIKKFFITYHLLILLLVPLYIAYDIRVQTRDLPITEDWARDTVYNNIRSQVTSQIQKSYPNLPENQRNELVNEQFNQLIQQRKEELEIQIKNQATYFKSRFNDDKGNTVLLDIDSYSYYRETRNLLTYGHNGNTKVNSTDWDTYIMAPKGVPAGKNLHNYLGVWQFKLWRMFDKDIYLMKSFFYLPMLVYVLAVIPAYMIGTYYGGAFGGLVTGIVLAIHPAVLTRTMAGVTDTDVYQILFPLLVVWVFLESFRRKTRFGMYLISSLAGILLGIYSFAWSGWWLIFYFLLAITFIHMTMFAYHHTHKGRINLSATWKQISVFFYMLLLFILFTALVITILRDFNFFLGFYTEPFAFLALKKAANPNLWPNVYTTVAELNPISLSGAISTISIGSNLLFWLSLLGILLAFFKRDPEGHIDLKLPALLAMWFISTLWASKSGVRFIGLAVPAFSIALGACFGIIINEGSAWLKRHLHIPELASKIVLIILFSLLLITPVRAGYATARHNIPLISDSWWQSLTEIHDRSAPNAIITSWWDFGHWFKAIADRPVTFDGGTQSTPIAHWVGKILLTADEKQAIGILRMLNCGSYQAAPELEAQGLSTLKAVDLLYSVFNKTKEEARQAYTTAGIKNPESVLRYTHCDPPESYFITSADMVGKSGVWAHFGSWDFKRSQIWLDRVNGSFDQRVTSIQTLGYTPQEAETIQREVLAIREEGEANTWIAPWPSYGGGAPCTKQPELLVCQNGLIVNLSIMNIVYTGETAPIHGLVYIDDKDLRMTTYPKYSQDIAIALVPAGDQLNAVFMQYPLGMSIFTRLFYLEGHGLHHFKRFSDKTSVLGERIIVWKIDWNGEEQNVYYHLNATQSKPIEPPQPINKTINLSSGKQTFKESNTSKENLPPPPAANISKSNTSNNNTPHTTSPNSTPINNIPDSTLINISKNTSN